MVLEEVETILEVDWCGSVMRENEEGGWVGGSGSHKAQVFGLCREKDK